MPQLKSKVDPYFNEFIFHRNPSYISPKWKARSFFALILCSKIFGKVWWDYNERSQNAMDNEAFSKKIVEISTNLQRIRCKISTNSQRIHCKFDVITTNLTIHSISRSFVVITSNLQQIRCNYNEFTTNSL